MKREQLKELGLSDEQIESVIGLHGKTVSDITSQLKTAQDEAKQYQDQLTANQSELNALKDSAKGNEELTNQLAELQAKFDDAQANSQNTIADLKKQSAIELALTQAGARNITAVKALLDADKLTVSDKGVEGLNEQLEAVKADNDYLFQATEPKTPTIVTGGNPQGGTDGKSIVQKIQERLGE